MRITITPEDHSKQMCTQFKKNFGVNISPESISLTADVVIEGKEYNDVKVKALHTEFAETV